MILPRVSIIIPCRNERAYLPPCLDSVLASDYPADRLEVFVVDGSSEDGTREICTSYAAADARVEFLENPARTTPHALNIGIRRARGDVIMRMDAHSRYPREYIGLLVRWLERSGADNVGVACRTLPSDASVKAKAIAVALAHPFGVGNSHFRIGVTEPKWVDTVPFGCYRRSVFERIGLFDEELVRNQDDEFNHRLLKHGGRILLVPDVRVDYFARDSMRRVALMYYQYGLFKPLVALKVGRIFTLRQLIPPLFVATLAVGAVLATWSDLALAGLASIGAAYLLTDLLVSLLAKAPTGLAVVPWLMITFPVIHVSYGVGFLRGLTSLISRLGRRPAPVSAIPLSR